MYGVCCAYLCRYLPVVRVSLSVGIFLQVVRSRSHIAMYDAEMFSSIINYNITLKYLIFALRRINIKLWWARLKWLYFPSAKLSISVKHIKRFDMLQAAASRTTQTHNRPQQQNHIFHGECSQSHTAKRGDRDVWALICAFLLPILLDHHEALSTLVVFYFMISIVYDELLCSVSRCSSLCKECEKSNTVTLSALATRNNII